MLCKVIKFFKNSWKKWKALSFWQKFIAINIAIPYVPLTMLVLSVLAPPEVVELATENGKTLVGLTGSYFQIASYAFAKSLGL